AGAPAGDPRPTAPGNVPRPKPLQVGACSDPDHQTPRSFRVPGPGNPPPGPNNRRAPHPRDAASLARALPKRPDDRFPMNRTASMGSWVGPAVMSMRWPVRVMGGVGAWNIGGVSPVQVRPGPKIGRRGSPSIDGMPTLKDNHGP